MSEDKYAVIDIGSLKVKHLIGGFKDRKFKIYHTDSNLTCLGKGLKLKKHEVKEENLVQTLDTVENYLNVSKEKGVDEVRIIATESLRKAENINQVLNRFETELSIELEIISQEEEARLLFSAVMNNINYCGDVIAADMGGGSVQLTFGNKEAIKDIEFLPLGAYYLQQNFFTTNKTENGKPTPYEIKRMKKYIQAEIDNIGINSLPSNTPLIYGSNNVLDLFNFLKFPLGDSKLGGNLKYSVSVADMMNFLDSISGLSYKEREEQYPFQYGYMWGIDCAFNSIRTLAEYFDTDIIVPSNVNIAEGIILDMFK